MNRTCIALYGLKASGKTFFSDYLHEKYNAKVLYLSRMLELKLCAHTPEGFAKYSELKLENSSRIPMIQTLENEIINEIKDESLIVIEGFLSNEDCEYFNEHFDLNCLKVLILNTDFNNRLQRFCNRHNYEKDTAMIELHKDDLFRIKAGYDRTKDSCNYVIDNNKTIDVFENNIDEFMKMIGEECV